MSDYRDRGQYDQGYTPRRGRDDEGQHGYQRAPEPQYYQSQSSTHDSPRDSIHTQAKQSSSLSRNGKESQALPLRDNEDLEEEEIAAQLAEIELVRKRLIARKASKQVLSPNRPSGSENGTGEIDTFTSIPNSIIERRGGGITRLSGDNRQDIGVGRPSRNECDSQLNTNTSRDFVPSARGQDAHYLREEGHKFYQGQRLSSNVFSPGYGFRPSLPGNDTLPLPEELVGPYGSTHRIYPAPSPISAPINANAGWVDHQASSTYRARVSPGPSAESIRSPPPPSEGPVTTWVRRQQERPLSPPPSDHAPTPPAKTENEEWGVTSAMNDREQPPHLSQPHKSISPAIAMGDRAMPSGKGADHTPTDQIQPTNEAASNRLQGSMVEWQPVIYENEDLNKESKPLPIDILLETFNRYHGRDARDEATRRAGDIGGGRFSRQQDQGWNRPAPQVEREGWTERRSGQQPNPQHAGFGGSGEDDWGKSPVTNMNSNKNDDIWNTGGNENNDSWSKSGNNNGYSGEGGGGGGGCHKCGEQGHFARGCPTAGPERCYNCGENGHMSINCPQEQKPKGSCYNCGEAGHQSRDCPEPRKSGGGGGGGGTCYNCGAPGHQSRDCPEPKKSGAFGGGDRGNGWGDQRAIDNHNQTNNSWGGDEGAEANGTNNDNQGWGKSSSNFNSEPAPASRPAANIHPDRANQVQANARTSYNREPEPQRHSQYDQPPNDGKRRDNGWGGRAQQTSAPTPASYERDPTPTPEDDENGGW